MNDVVQLTLALTGAPDSDTQELDQLTTQLRERLLELDVTSVKPARSGEIPPGAKPADPAAIGALVVTLVPALLQAAVSLVETWAGDRRVRSVKATIGGDSIELVDPASDERERLVELFLDRHATR